MVLHITHPNPRTMGLLEGDRVTTIGGKPVSDDITRADYMGAVLMNAGATVEVEWVRPGTGKMRGVLTLQPAPRSDLSEVESCIPWKEPSRDPDSFGY